MNVSRLPTCALLSLLILSLRCAPGLGSFIGDGRWLDTPFSDEHRTVAETAYHRATLITALEQILQWHQTNDTQIPKALNSGQDKAAIKAALADLPCQPPEELLELWAWHDGTAGQEYLPFIWYHDFLSVEEALDDYESLMTLPGLKWQETWIPIFSFEGEWYFVECYPEPRLASPVGYYFLEDTETYYTFLNLTTMMATSAAWYKENAVRWNGERQVLEEDLKHIFEIYQQFNEGADFPYAVQ